MMEMAACGKILHLRCVEYARRENVRVHVRSSFSDKDGTWVQGSKEGSAMEQAIISGVVHDRSEAKITIVGVPDRVGEAARIFTAVAAAEINIDMIVQNVSAVQTRDRHLLHPAQNRWTDCDGNTRRAEGRCRLRRRAL